MERPWAQSFSAGAGAALGAYTGNPEYAVAGAALSPWGAMVLAQLGQGTLEKVSWLGERAARGGDVEKLLAHLADYPEAAALLLEAGRACASTQYERKIEAIGRVIAQGVLYEDGVAFDIEATIVRAVCALNRPHIAVLNHLSQVDPEALEVSGIHTALPLYSDVLPALLGDLIGWGLAYGTSLLYPGRVSMTDARATELGLVVLKRFLDVADGIV